MPRARLPAAANGSGGGSGSAGANGSGKGDQGGKPDASQPDKPWKLAATIRNSLFDARSGLLLDGDSESRDLAKAQAALSGSLERGLKADAPADLGTIRRGLADAERAIGRQDPVGLASAYGTVDRRAPRRRDGGDHRKRSPRRGRSAPASGC